MRRPPLPADLLGLARALAEHDVEYAIIGGTAMALFGFPRATRDIDLLLPRSPENNQRLLRALAAVPGLETAASALDARYLDQGFSTAAEGDIAVDLLYVAAGKTFEDLRKHVRIVEVSGESVAALDIDGMLATKQTDRATDIPDRQRLQRLKAEIDGKPRKPRPG